MTGKPRLALVEPFAIGQLPNRPNLGCAMLIAAARERGREIRLVTGHSRWLQDTLLRDQQELFELLREFDEPAVRAPEVERVRTRARSLGAAGFRETLAGLHNTYFVEKRPQSFLDATQLAELLDVSTAAAAVYNRVCERGDGTHLAIVRRYLAAVAATDASYAGFSLDRFPGPLMRTVISAVREELALPVVFGGWITPFLTEAQIRDLLPDNSQDSVVIGLADEILPDLLDAIDEGREPHSVPGVFQRRDGTVLGRPAHVLPDLAKLPFPDFGQYDLDAFPLPVRILPFQTARGCSWRKCTFCAHIAIYQGEYQRASLERVVDCIEHLRDRYGCTHLVSHDEELPAKRADLLSDAILRRGPSDAHLYTYARLVKQFDDRHLFDKMYRAGFRSLVWGLESGSQRVLDLMEKGTEPDEMGRILDKAADRGLGNLCFVMFGFPGETESEAEETVAFLEANAASVTHSMIDVFQMEPGTPVASAPERWGVVVADDGSWHAQDGMTRRQAIYFHRKFLARQNLGELVVNAFPFFLRDTISRMLIFACQSHGVVDPGRAATAFAERPDDGVYPMILGRLRRADGEMALELVDTARTADHHRLRPAETVVLDEPGRRIVELADGSRSLAEIRSLLGDRAGHASAFVARLLAKRSGYLFLRPWTVAGAQPAAYERLSGDRPDRREAPATGTNG